MKVHKRINYYHNRHRSDGILIEKREIRNENETEDLFLSNQEVIKSFNIKNNLNNFSHTSLNFYKKPNMNNKNREELNLTEENMKNISYQNTNTFNLELTNDEDYLTMEYNNTSDKLIKNLSLLYNELSLKENKIINNFKNNNTKNIDEENILLIKENMKLEQEIKILNKDYSQIEIEKLCDINRKLIKENEYLSSMINKIKISKNNENIMNNSMKYKTDFLVQNKLNSMKDLISILDNESNKDLYMNTNMTLDNKSCNYIPTENLDNFAQSSFSQENQFK